MSSDSLSIIKRPAGFCFFENNHGTDVDSAYGCAASHPSLSINDMEVNCCSSASPSFFAQEMRPV